MPDGPNAARAEVAVVIVSYNTRALLERCLDAVEAGRGGRTVEVCVVDNASADGSAETVATRWPDVVLIRNEVNRGYAPACNQGLARARSPYVLALNSDALLCVDALTELIRHLEAHPGAGAVGPRLLNADGSTQWVCARRAPHFLSSLLAHTQLGAYLPGVHGLLHGTYPPAWYAQAADAEVLSGACILFRREALDRVGLLEDRLVLNYDDVEWCMRARRRGLNLRYEPAAEVTHFGGASRAFDPESNSTANVRSIAVFWDLAFPPLPAAALKLGLMASIGLSLVKNAILAPFAAARRPRVTHLVRLFHECARMLARPSVSGAEGRAWRSGRVLPGRDAPGAV